MNWTLWDGVSAGTRQQPLDQNGSVLLTERVRQINGAWTDRMWVTPVRPPGLSGPAVSGGAGVLGDGGACGSVGPEERGRRRTRLCDLRQGQTVANSPRPMKTTPPDPTCFD